MTISRARWFDSVWYEYLEGRIKRWPPWQKPIRGTMLDTTHPLARGLISAFVLNEGTGLHINDSLIDHPSMTWNNSGNFSWDRGALRQDGSSGSIELDSNDLLEDILIGQTQMTVACRFRAEVLTTGIVIYWGDDNATPYYEAVYLSLMANGVVRFVVDQNFMTSANDKYSANTVHDFVGTYDGSSGRIYVDAKLVDGPDSYSATIAEPTSGRNIAIMGKPLGASGSLDGWLYHLYIWNRGLSEAEIAQLHREPYGMFL